MIAYILTQEKNKRTQNLERVLQEFIQVRVIEDSNDEKVVDEYKNLFNRMKSDGS